MTNIIWWNALKVLLITPSFYLIFFSSEAKGNLRNDVLKSLSVDDESYFFDTGRGITYDIATTNATNSLVNRLISTVQSESVLIQKSNNGVVSESFKDITHISSTKINLPTLEIVEHWRENGYHFVKTRVSKALVSDSVKRQWQDYENEMQVFVNDNNENFSISCYFDVLSLSSRTESINSISILAKSMGVIVDDSLINKFNRTKSRCLGQKSLKLESESPHDNIDSVFVSALSHQFNFVENESSSNGVLRYRYNISKKKLLGQFKVALEVHVRWLDEQNKLRSNDSFESVGWGLDSWDEAFKEAVREFNKQLAQLY